MKRFILIYFIFFGLSCIRNKDKTEELDYHKPIVAVVNYPLFYFAQSIGGELIEVYFPVINGDPAYWKPDATDIQNFQNATLILDNGAGYAKWMEMVSLPASKTVNTSLSFKDQWIEMSEGITHSHGPEGEHAHQGTAFTTWLNFHFALKQAESVYLAFKRILPEKNNTELEKNFIRLKHELISLDEKMESIASQIQDEILLASHPVYQYLESDYGLHLRSLHWEPDEMPGEEEWIDLEKIVRETKSNIMIWEDEPNVEIKSGLKNLGITIVVFNPCANKPESDNFLEVMNENLRQLEQVLKPV